MLLQQKKIKVFKYIMFTIFQMVQQQRSPGAVLYENYDNYNPVALSTEEAGQLVRYCLGIVHNLEKVGQRRLEKTTRILIEQGYRAPNYLPPALADKQHLDYLVGLFSEIVRQHPEPNFMDALARNLTGALSNENQREGAFRVLGLEQVCGAALRYVASRLKDDSLYGVVSAFFKKAAEMEQHRQAVFGVLTWATGQQELAINAALVLNSLADKYWQDIGTRVDTATGQLASDQGLEGRLRQ